MGGLEATVSSDPSDDAFGSFDLAALLRLPHLKHFLHLRCDRFVVCRSGRNRITP